MRLEEIRIQNYRCIDDITLRFPPNKPVILFGPNNAGKSNILSAILTLRRFSMEYAYEPKWRPIANGALVYDTSNLNGTRIIQDRLDPLTAKFTNSGAPSRGCDSATEITLTVDLGSHKEQIEIGFCEFNNYLPYVKNSEVLQKLPLPTDSVIPFIQVWESGSGDPSYYLDYLKIVRGEEGNRSPEWFLKLIPEIDKRVSDSIKDIKEFDRFPQGKGENAPADLFFVGSGQQAWVGRFGDLAAASVIKSAVDDLQLVLMDEPETHLHPNAEAQLWGKIQTASENGVQVILTTHSENFLCVEDLEGFVRVHKEGDKTKVQQLTNEELYTLPVLGDINKKSLIKDYWTLKLNSDQLKGFFANVILLVEGQTEQYALPIYLGRSFLAENGIQIVPCYSKTAIQNYWRLFTAYGYKCFILYDYDTTRKKDEKKDERELNEKLEAYFYGTRKTDEHYSISETAAYFKKDYESCFKFSLGERYKVIKDDLKKNYGIKLEGKRPSAKPLRALDVALKVVKENVCIPFIEEVLKPNLSKLSGMTSDKYRGYTILVRERLEQPKDKYLRKVLWHKGIRYKKNVKELPGTPDIAITKWKIAIFCYGAFWHGKDFDSKGLLTPVEKCWETEIRRNMERDAKAEQKLKDMGWSVIHFWSEDIDKRLDECVAQVEKIVMAAKEGGNATIEHC